MIYVANEGPSFGYIEPISAGTVSFINGLSGKIAAGIMFNPANAGIIICGDQEYSINTYIYVDRGTRCTGQNSND
jgi:hypothetical protein